MRIVRSAMSVSVFTLLSRIMGFIRDMLVASYLGAGTLSDIWVAAFRFPNLFRRIIAEGAFSSAFIPVYGKIYTQKGEEEADIFTGNILSLFGLWVVVAVIFFQITMPYFIYVFSPGYSETFIAYVKQLFFSVLGQAPFPTMPNFSSDDKISLTVTLTIICLPYAGFMFLVGLMSGLLNYHHKFAAPASVPALLNTILCIGLVGGTSIGIDPLFSLGYAVCMAGIIQVAFLYYFIRKMKIGFKFGKLNSSSNMDDFKKLFWAGFIAGGVIQINLLIGSLVASLEDGATSYLYYADRVYQLPLSLVGISLAVVLLPALVRKISEEQWGEAQTLLARTTEFAAFLTLPASFAMMILPYEITSFLFERGAFTTEATKYTSHALIFYGFGLPAFILIKLYEPGFFARHNTKTPMKYAVQSIMVNIVCSLSLFPFLGFYAIPLATILASWKNALILGYILKKDTLIVFDKELKNRLLKILGACILMSIFVWFTRIFIHNYWLDAGKTGSIVLIVAGLLSYFVFAHFLSIFPKGQFIKYLKRSKA